MFTLDTFADEHAVSNGDLLFAWSGSPETSIGTFVWVGTQGWLNRHIFKVVPDMGCTREFVLSQLRYLNPQFIEIARNKQTTGLGHVTVRDLKEMTVTVPSPEITEAYRLMVGPLLHRSHLVMLESESLAAIRDALLPKLLSGELRVKEAEKMLQLA